MRGFAQAERTGEGVLCSGDSLSTGRVWKERVYAHFVQPGVCVGFRGSVWPEPWFSDSSTHQADLEGWLKQTAAPTGPPEASELVRLEWGLRCHS